MVTEHRVGPLRALLAVLAATVAFAGDAAHAQTPLALSADPAFHGESGSRWVAEYAYIAGSPITGANRPFTYGRDPTRDAHKVKEPVMPTASGGTAPYDWSISFRDTRTGTAHGAADLGLTFDTSTNPPTLRATTATSLTLPSGSGFHAIFDVAVTVTDSASPAASVSRSGVMAIQADSAPSFAASESSVTFYTNYWDEWEYPAATGGNFAFNDNRYSLSASVPAGLYHLQPARRILGRPTTAVAETEYTLTVTDRDGDTATTTLKITVAAPAATDAPAFPRAAVSIPWYVSGYPYHLYESTGGPYTKVANLPPAKGLNLTYSASGLPSGLTLTLDTTVPCTRNGTVPCLSGSPTQAGTHSATITATNAHGSATLAVTIHAVVARNPYLAPPKADSCTSVRLTWREGSNRTYPNTNSPAPAPPAVTGWTLQGQQPGDAGWTTLVNNGSASVKAHTHTVPSGSSWLYRVKAHVSGGESGWSHVRTVSASRNALNDTDRRAAYEKLEVGMTLAYSYGSSTFLWDQAGVTWQRSDDAASPSWSEVSTADGFYTLTPADAGKLFRVVRTGAPVFSNRGTHLDWIWTHPTMASAVALLPYYFNANPVAADNAPAFASSSMTYPAVAAGDAVNLQLGAAGGSAPVTYAISPAPPPGSGLTFDTATGALTGTAASDLSQTFTVTARDADCDEATFTAYVGTTAPAVILPPSEPPPGVRLRVTAEVAGPVPPGRRFTVGYACLGAGGSFHIWPGEARYVHVPPHAPCSLSVHDDGGARAVSGTFEDRTFRTGTLIDLLFDFAEPEPAVAVIETRVWQSLRHAERLWISARHGGGSWTTLGTVRLPLDQVLIPGGRLRAGTVTLDAPAAGGDATVTIDVRVVRDGDTGAVYVDARSAGGPWANGLGLAVPLDRLSSSGRYRYGDTVLEVPLEETEAEASAP